MTVHGGSSLPTQHALCSLADQGFCVTLVHSYSQEITEGRTLHFLFRITLFTLPAHAGHMFILNLSIQPEKPFVFSWQN